MAAELQGAQVTLSTVPQTLTALIRAQNPAFIDQAFSIWSVRADSANAGQVRILRGPVDNASNRCGFLAAGESTSVDIRSAGVHTNGIWFMSSTPGDTLWVMAIVI